MNSWYIYRPVLLHPGFNLGMFHHQTPCVDLKQILVHLDVVSKPIYSFSHHTRQLLLALADMFKVERTNTEFMENVTDPPFGQSRWKTSRGDKVGR